MALSFRKIVFAALVSGPGFVTADDVASTTPAVDAVDSPTEIEASTAKTNEKRKPTLKNMGDDSMAGLDGLLGGAGGLDGLLNNPSIKKMMESPEMQKMQQQMGEMFKGDKNEGKDGMPDFGKMMEGFDMEKMMKDMAPLMKDLELGNLFGGGDLSKLGERDEM